MNDTINVVYKIKFEKKNSWDKDKKLQILSNLSDDKVVDCQISKRLSEKLIKDSAILKPEQLICEIAESQKRGFKSELEMMDDLELEIKTKADKIQATLGNLLKDYETKSYDIIQQLYIKAGEVGEKLDKKVKSFSNVFDKLGDIDEKMKKIDNYDLERFTENMTKLSNILKSDKDLVEFVIKNYEKKENKKQQ